MTRRADTDSPGGSWRWDAAADQKVLAAIIKTSKSPIDLKAVVEEMGNVVTVKALQHRIAKIKSLVGGAEKKIVGESPKRKAPATPKRKKKVKQETYSDDDHTEDYSQMDKYMKEEEEKTEISAMKE